MHLCWTENCEVCNRKISKVVQHDRLHSNSSVLCAEALLPHVLSTRGHLARAVASLSVRLSLPPSVSVSVSVSVLASVSLSRARCVCVCVCVCVWLSALLESLPACLSIGRSLSL